MIQLTLDGGKHWTNVTPPARPEYGRLRRSRPSPLVDGTAYAVNDGHYTGDNKPYVFVTHDFGKTWTSIATGLPDNEWARSIAADIRNRNLVYLGTEEGIWISYDGGAKWQAFKNDLPTVSVHDIRMQPQFNDLVIATHGRSIYIMDDMTPVQQLQSAVAAGTYAVYAVRRSYQYNQTDNDEGTYTNYAADESAAGRDHQPTIRKTCRRTHRRLQILDAHRSRYPYRIRARIRSAIRTSRTSRTKSV